MSDLKKLTDRWASVGSDQDFFNNLVAVGKASAEKERQKSEAEAAWRRERAEQEAKWSNAGLCTRCGGAFGGFFVKKCMSCKIIWHIKNPGVILGIFLIFAFAIAGLLFFVNSNIANTLLHMGLWQVEFIPNTIPLQHYVVEMIAISEGYTMSRIFLNFLLTIGKPYLLIIVCCVITVLICNTLWFRYLHLVHYAYILIGFGITLWFVINPIINPDVFGYRFTTPNPYFVDDFNIMSRSILWRMAFVMAPLAAFIITKDLISTINYGDPFDKISISLIGSAIYVISVIFSVSNYHGNLNQFPIFFFLVLSIVIGLCIIIISQIVSNIMASLTAFLR